MNVIYQENQKKITVLLTSAGGLTGIFLSKYYSKNTNYKIVAIDMWDINPLTKWVDAFYKVPSVKDIMFLTKIKEIIEKESVDILIPITSYDVDFFSKYEIRSQLKGVKILTMDYNYHNILHDKETCYQYLNKLGICTPKIYTQPQDLRFPCIIKPKRGTGSKNTVIINDKNDYVYWMGKIDNSIVIQYLEGKEYTVDCLFDLKGKCVGANVRERVKTTGGGATVSKNTSSICINSVLKKLEGIGAIKGPINFQFKILPNKELCVFDFNTRLASGGLPLTVQSGFDIPKLLIKILLGEDVEKWEMSSENDGITMVRYYEEFYINE